MGFSDKCVPHNVDHHIIGIDGNILKFEARWKIIGKDNKKERAKNGPLRNTRHNPFGCC